MAKMEKKRQPANDYFLKLPTALFNGRKDRPPLNSLERELCAYLMGWTANGRGRYNYESTKEIARTLGSSNKTVLKALHRLKALQLVAWYSFPHGVGVKHLRWFKADGLQRWAASGAIAEPTAEDLAKAAEFTPVEKLRRDVCNKPNSVGHDIWRACCTYCEFTPEGKTAKAKKAKAATPGDPLPVDAAAPVDAVQLVAPEPVEALPFDSPEFAAAWQTWKAHRKESGRPLRGNAEQMALQQLANDAESEADAINAIRSAIAGGFMALRPDIARSKSGGATNPPCPVNLWSWMQRQFELRQRQPESMDEAKEWAAEFRTNNPDAPGYVIWQANKKRWALPGPNDSARRAGVNGKYVELCEGFEQIRQAIDEDGPRAELAKLENFWKQESEDRQTVEAMKARRNIEIQAAYLDEVKARGGYIADAERWTCSAEDLAREEKVHDAVREILPVDLSDALERFPHMVQDIRDYEREAAVSARQMMGAPMF